MSNELTVTLDFFNSLSTTAIQSTINRKEALEITKVAKGGSWYDDAWTPYCLAEVCMTMPRMVRTNYGFRCPHCKNMIGHDLCRLQEFPLNYK